MRFVLKMTITCRSCSVGPRKTLGYKAFRGKAQAPHKSLLSVMGLLFSPKPLWARVHPARWGSSLNVASIRCAKRSAFLRKPPQSSHLLCCWCFGLKSYPEMISSTESVAWANRMGKKWHPPTHTCIHTCTDTHTQKGNLITKASSKSNVSYLKQIWIISFQSNKQLTEIELYL